MKGFRLQFLDQHATIEIRLAAHLILFVRGWGVFINTIFAGIIDSHNY